MSAAPKQPFSESFSRVWSIGFALFLVARCAWIFGTPERVHNLPLRFAQDDFFYYVKTAQNLVSLHKSTLDGHTVTNGYHPLYFLLLAVVSIFVHTVPGIFRFLWALDLVSATASFFLLRKLFRQVCSSVLSNVLAAILVSLCLSQICDQMEVTLALPLGFAFLLAAFVEPNSLTPRRAFVMGILAAFLFLARLDAVLLVAVSITAMLLSRSYRAVLTTTHILAFCAAALPLPLLYLATNELFFHTLLPISGMAKQLRHGWIPSLLLPRSFSGINEVLVLLSVATMVLCWALRHRLNAREKVFLLATLTTPFLFYGIEMLVSDWPVWDWYFYPLRFAATGSALLFAGLSGRIMLPTPYQRLQGLLQSRSFAVLLGIAALGRLAVTNYKVDIVMVDIQQASERLTAFAATHPGVYAMGDRAGMFAMTTTSPVIQAEGLMMNRPYLQHIRNEVDLRSVLTRYGAQYYVTFVFDRNAWQFQGDCLQALEPSIAGPSADRMRSRFCSQPLLRFRGDEGTYLVYGL